jgi:hypothetical protein
LDENVVWLDEDQIKGANLTGEEMGRLTPDEIITRVKATVVVKRKEQVIGAVLAELQAGNFIGNEQVEAVKQRLNQARTIAAHFKG